MYLYDKCIVTKTENENKTSVIELSDLNNGFTMSFQKLECDRLVVL